MASLADRFEAKVDRSGDHHIWLGSKTADGIGKLKVEGKMVSAHRVAWELEHGPPPEGSAVRTCPETRPCVRVEHLALVRRRSAATRPARQRSPRGGGSKAKLKDGVWKLTVRVGRYDDGRPRREHETVYAETEEEANRELARFVAEVHSAPLPDSQVERDVVVDDAIEQYLSEYLVGEKGREANTIRVYRNVHRRWFSPVIGRRRVRDVDEAVMDRIFGKMRQAGLSTSRMQDARNLYAPFFRWAKRRRIIRRNPMTDFEVPTSTHVATEHTPPEVEQLCRYLSTAVEVVPDVAPVLALGAVTGMRRGELMGIRRSRLFPADGRVRVDVATDGKKVKATKTRRERDVSVDTETMAMLLRHCAQMDERAALCGVQVAPDAFVFSLEPDCAGPMPTDHLTEQVAKLKEHLGIADKKPATVALEDEALRLRRQPVERPKGTPGPTPTAPGLSYAEIGRRLDRSERWAYGAVASAERREAAVAQGPVEMFDGSVVALRKFTSTELLDAGFNISMVAHRQGHGPQVLVKHYAKARRSADRRAAEHLGQVVHQRDGNPQDQTRAS
jgi:integrase